MQQEEGSSRASNSSANERTNIPTRLAFCQLDDHPSCARVAHYRLLTAAISTAARFTASKTSAAATRKPRRAARL